MTEIWRHAAESGRFARRVAIHPSLALSCCYSTGEVAVIPVVDSITVFIFFESAS